MSAASHEESNLTACVTGFALSLVLTALSFAAVMSGVLPPAIRFDAIVALAVVQLVVQLVFFLHLGLSPEQRNTTVIFLLTVLLLTTVVTGSLWVMHNANANMTPMQMSMEMARQHE